MTSVFKKLIRREFGEKSYNNYFDYYHKNIDNQSIDNKEVFDDIYKKLKECDTNTILSMHERLSEALLSSFRISRSYLLVPITYFIAVLFLLAYGTQPIIAVPAVIIVSICFVMKSYEFIVNKYCYIDARIILVYKSVLEVLLLGKKDYSA